MKCDHERIIDGLDMDHLPLWVLSIGSVYNLGCKGTAIEGPYCIEHDCPFLAEDDEEMGEGAR